MKKTLAIVAVIIVTMTGTLVAADSLGFFDNATIVRNNIIKLGQLAKDRKQALESQNGQLNSLKQELANKQQELVNKQNEVNAKQAEINAKQEEVNAKQAEVNAKQNEVNELKQKLSEDERKDAEMQSLAELSQQTVEDVK